MDFDFDKALESINEVLERTRNGNSNRKEILSAIELMNHMIDLRKIDVLWCEQVLATAKKYYPSVEDDTYNACISGSNEKSSDVQFLANAINDFSNEEDDTYGNHIGSIESKISDAKAEIYKYSRIVEELECCLKDYKNFNKQIFLENVKFLLKNNQEIKISRIEKEAGVSPGYMSRLMKADNATEPSIEFALTASMLLEKSLILLLTASFEKLSPTEEFAINLIEKLGRDTMKDKLYWEVESATCLNYMYPDEDDRIGHPLFEINPYTKEPSTIFLSHSFGFDTYINDDCYELAMGKNSKLYLMDVARFLREGEHQNAKEVWMYVPRKEKHFIAGTCSNERIAKMIEELFALVKEKCNCPKIKKEVKDVLDEYMVDNEIDEMEDGF